VSKPLYERLKIEENASPADIRRAYHKLAMLYHPDRNLGDKDAENKFKDIATAFEVLGDQKARALYDQGRLDDQGRPCLRSKTKANPTWMWSQASEAFREEFAKRAFETGYQNNKAAKPQDKSVSQATDGGSNEDGEKQYRLAISFIEAAVGTVKHVRLPNKAQFKINIPAGVETGQRLRVKSAGVNGKPFVVKITAEPHIAFERDGYDIHLDVPLTPYEAFFGLELDVPTIHGPAKVTIPPMSQDGAQVVMEQMGLRPPAQVRGDQIIHVAVVMPSSWSEEAAAAMETWKKKAPFNPRGKILNLLAK